MDFNLKQDDVDGAGSRAFFSEADSAIHVVRLRGVGAP